MTQRTTEMLVTFVHPFQLSSLLIPLAPGTYRVTIEADTIPGLRFKAFRQSATRLYIPCVGVLQNKNQYIRVDPKELAAARLKDNASVIEDPHR